MRTECFNCTNKIEKEGDAFCTQCDDHFALNDNGEVITIEEWNDENL